jgi:phage terminase large subunit-like protein
MPEKWEINDSKMHYEMLNIRGISALEYTVTLPSSKGHPIQAEFVDCTTKRVIVRAGRRGGKTVGVGIKACKEFLNKKRVLYAAPTSDQVNRFWVTVVNAFQEPIDRGVIYKNETLHVLEIPGTEIRIRAKSAWNADSLRGDYADVLILDEFSLINEDAWALVGAPMLLDNDGSAIFIYTPPSLHSRSVSKANDPRHAAKLFIAAQEEEKLALKEGRPSRWKTFHFSSMDNPYISKDALAEITQDMTSLAYRMEILAQDVSEAPGALWTRNIIDQNRMLQAPAMDRVVVGVDPSATSGGDEAGIVGAGKFGDEGYVLEDASVQGSPLVWATAAVTLYHKLSADCIIAESNQGGEMVSAVIHQVDPSVPVKLVHASRGKATRAEPISAKYENGKIHHIGKFAQLEDELCLWVPGDASPNRLDAMVWALSSLMLGPGGAQLRVVGDEKPEDIGQAICSDCGETKECVQDGDKIYCLSCLREKRAWEEMSKDD